MNKKFSVTKYIFLFPAFVSIFSIAYLFTDRELNNSHFISLLLVNLTLWLSSYLRFINLEIIIHPQHLQILHPLQNKNYFIPYSDIKEVNFNFSFVGLFFDYGVFRLILQDNVPIRFSYLQNGKKLLTTILSKNDSITSNYKEIDKKQKKETKRV